MAGALRFSGLRFSARYRLTGTEAEARERAGHICLEQTVELPDDLVSDPSIREHVYGQLLSLEVADDGAWEAEISYAVEIVGTELPQLLNVLFGNVSLLPGVRLETVELPLELLELYGGPRFGRDGLRRVARAEGRPMLATALKPMGLSPRSLARQAEELALGGVDLVKDDHGLADQSFCSFEERLRRCSDAVRSANARSGGSSLYAPNVTAPAERLVERAEQAQRAGAGALVVSGGLVGLDGLRCLADCDLGLPIVMHPSLLGSFVTSRDSGMSHFVLFGQLARLSGADACIFPHSSGRFSFSSEECRQVAAGASVPMGPIKRAFPVPAGGMTLEGVPEICRFYGGELIVLIGGDLHRHPGGLAEASRELRRAVSSWSDGAG